MTLTPNHSAVMETLIMNRKIDDFENGLLFYRAELVNWGVG